MYSNCVCRPQLIFLVNHTLQLHNFYYPKWIQAVGGNSNARKYFGKPRTNSSVPTIQFALDRARRCPDTDSTESVETNTYHIQNRNNPGQEGLAAFRHGDTKYLKFFKFNFNDQYEFKLPSEAVLQRRQPKPKPELKQPSEDKFLENLKNYGFNQINDRKRDSVEKYCTIRLPSHIRSDRGYDSEKFKKLITDHLQNSDKNFLNNTWYVFYKHHSWDNSIFGTNNKYFQYGNPDTKITGKEFIDYLNSNWTSVYYYDNINTHMQNATSDEEKLRAKERAAIDNNELNVKIQEQNLVVKYFVLVREFAQFLDSCKQ